MGKRRWVIEVKRRKVIEEGFAECGSSEYAPWEGHWPSGK